MTHKPLLSKAQREKIVQVFFEKCNVKGAFLTTDAQMSVRAMGKTTGLVVDIGTDMTNIVPIYEDMIVRVTRTIYPYLFYLSITLSIYL